MNDLQIAGIPILQDEAGRYCLNSLHRSAGGDQKHRPKYWLDNKQTQELIYEIAIGGIPPIESKQGLGTYACKELVYAYAMWISPAFHLQVIRAYDALVMQQLEAVKAPETTLPPSVGHRADHIVSASRCFSGLMRVATALKLPHGRAVQSAMASARRHTGVDLMTELGVTQEDLIPASELRQNGLKRSHFPEESKVVAWLNAPEQAVRDQFSNEEILRGALGCTARQIKDRSKRTRVGHIMSRLGWYHSRQRNYSGPNREQIVVYSRPPI